MEVEDLPSGTENSYAKSHLSYQDGLKRTPLLISQIMHQMVNSISRRKILHQRIRAGMTNLIPPQSPRLVDQHLSQHGAPLSHGAMIQPLLHLVSYPQKHLARPTITVMMKPKLRIQPSRPRHLSHPRMSPNP